MDASERVVVGRVDSVSSSGFVITTGAGQTVTVRKRSSTAYWKTGTPASAQAVIRGVGVAVLGTPAGPALAAAAVAVLPSYVMS